MTFDGKGDFTGSGSFVASGSGTSGAVLGAPSNNYYGVFSNGLIFMNNPFDTTGNTPLFGGVGNGALAMSSTDTNYCDLMVAMPVSTNNSAANLNGTYYIASMEFLNGAFSSSRDTFFSATFDGKGSLGNVTINGTALNLANAATSQTSNGATFTVSANGTGTLVFPAPSGVAANNVLISGTKNIFVAPDGSFFIGGGATTYDFVIGVKAAPGVKPNGLYFTSYLENVIDTTNNNAFTIYGADGSVNEVSSIGVEIGHQRVNPDFTLAYDDTYGVGFSPVANGTVTYSDSVYAVGAGGNIIIGAGSSSNYQLTFYVKSPALSGTGVFLHPQGVVNAASSVPFTASVAPGEFISLNGSGLAGATTTANSLPFPTTLGNVQVKVSWTDANGNAQSAFCPVYYASPTLVDALVPYSTPGDGSVLTFQVINNGTPSNSTLLYSGPTAPGIFTIPSGGIGNGAIEHADFSVVTTSSPAKVGETVQIFLTGMGKTTPAVNTGAAAPSNPLATATVPDVYIDGILAKVVFSGLTPGAAGLYQLNVTIPSGVTAGANVTIEIDTFDSNDDLLTVNAEATIPISK